MYLYELALELDVKSLELAGRAQAAGVDGAGPNTLLTAVQVQALRSGTTVPPPPPPAPEAGPGPSFVPPPPPPAAPEAPAASTDRGRPLSWAASDPSGSSGPDEPPAAGPLLGGPPAGTDAPTALPAAPPAATGSTLPPPPGMGGVPLPGGDGPHDEPSGLRAMPTGQKAVIGVLVAGVLALFTFMAVTNAPKGARAAPGTLAADAEPRTTVPAATDAIAGISDRGGFCAALKVLGDTWPEDDPQLAAATDLASVKTLLMERNAAWTMATAGLRGSTSGSVAVDVEAMIAGFERRMNMFLDAKTDADVTRAYKGTSSVWRGGELDAQDRILALASAHC